MKRILPAAVCAAMLLLPASFAQGAELLYWGNFGDNTISFADTAGGGGGQLNLAGVAIDEPEGMAFDSATGRLFVASNEGGPRQEGAIVAVNVDSSGAVVFSAPGAPVSEPVGIVIDPRNGTAYWSNSGTDTIGWARVDGSAGGTLNTSGATIEAPSRVAIDPAARRIYWVNERANPESISFANLDHSGGGDLDLTGATQPEILKGLSVDPVAGRLYWLDAGLGSISFVNLTGGGGADLPPLAGAPIEDPLGMAFDPLVGRFYWGNFGTRALRTGAFGFADLAGGRGGIDIATAPANGPQYPVILKSPTGAGAPLLTRSAKVRTALSCSTGAWAPDFAGSFVYRGPSKFAYQWTRDGKPVAGATASTLNATAAGVYACAVTASNQAGSAVQTSAAVNVSAAKLQLRAKTIRARAGKVAMLKLRIRNGGDLAATGARLCVKVGKRAKALKAPKCKPLGTIPAGASRTRTLRLKVGAAASGSYRVNLTVKGAAAKAATAKIVVPK